MDAITGFSSAFLAGASAVSASAVMIHMRNFGGLVAAGQVECLDVNNDNNCALTGPYGNGSMAINILSVIFNAIFLLMILNKWMELTGQSVKRQENKAKLQRMHMVFGLVVLTVVVAIATTSFNIHVQQNFGQELENGNFGDTCPKETRTAGCTELTGTTGDTLMGLNAASITLSGLSLLFYFALYGYRSSPRVDGFVKKIFA